MYDIKLGIAILDWNEHVGRPATSVQVRIRHDQPRRRSGYRVLTAKTYSFVDRLWNCFVRLLNNHQLPQNEQDEDVENVDIDNSLSDYDNSDDNMDDDDE